MKVKKIVINNFAGIKHEEVEFNSKVIAKVGKNGTGKSSFLNAVRYALTGLEPDGDVLYHGADEMSVSITLADDTGELHEFTRSHSKDKPSKFYADGSKTTQKTLNEVLTSVVGVPLENINVASSTEIIRAMKPQEFSSFILKYVTRKMTLEDVIKLMTKTTPDMLSIMEKNLPEKDIVMETLDTFDKYLRATRKDMKAVLASQKSAYSTKPHEAPGLDKEDLMRVLADLHSAETRYNAYLKEQKSYESMLMVIESQKKNIEDLKTREGAIAATRPNPAELKAIEDRIVAENKSVDSQKKSLTAVYTAVKQLRATLEALETNVCPISPLITCHTDKTVAKEEISNTIEANEEALKLMNDELVNAEKRLEKAINDRQAYRENETAYSNKILLKAQIKNLEDAMPKEPKKPDAVEAPPANTDEYVNAIKVSLKKVDEYESGIELAKKIENLANQIAVYDDLIDAFTEKGPVRTSIVREYLKIFEDLCNNRSKKFRPDITFRFEGADGVVPMMKIGSGDFLNADSLSGGERAYMLFMLADMLNQLTGSGLLLLDELNVCDKDTLDALLSLVIDRKDDYDHIIIASVDHKDIVESFGSHGLL